MKRIILFITVCAATLFVAGCTNTDGTDEDTFVDYVAATELTADYEGKSFFDDGIAEVTLVSAIDGDTAHFYEVGKTSLIKIRFLGIDTPESTGKIEEWGKAASNFTATALSSATTIVIQAETSTPEVDSTGSRYLAWVWYDGKLLNLELVQEGYTLASSASNTLYGDTLFDADLQAQQIGNYIWSDELDPDYYYGEAVIVSLEELKTNIDDYYGKKVCFEGTVTRKVGTNAYLEYETEAGEHYGIYVYTMYSSTIGAAFTSGNEMRVIGTVSYYSPVDETDGEEYGTYQIVDVSYNQFFPSEDDVVILSTGNTVEATVISVTDLDKTVNPYLAHTFVSLKNITVTGGYDESDSDAITMYAQDSDGNKFTLRVDSGTYISSVTSYEDLVGKTFDVSGLVTVYLGDYQVSIASSVDVVIY